MPCSSMDSKTSPSLTSLKICKGLSEMQNALMNQDYLKSDQSYFRTTLSNSTPAGLLMHPQIFLGLRRLMAFWKDIIYPLPETVDEKQLKRLRKELEDKCKRDNKPTL